MSAYTNSAPGDLDSGDALECIADGIRTAQALLLALAADMQMSDAARATVTQQVDAMTEWASNAQQLMDDTEPDDESGCAHDWVYTGTAYGGDDDSYHGEGRCYCSKCGTDGDA